MVTGLSSRPIRVGDLVTVDEWFVENYFNAIHGHSGIGIVLETSNLPNIAKVQLIGTRQVGWCRVLRVLLARECN